MGKLEGRYAASKRLRDSLVGQIHVGTFQNSSREVAKLIVKSKLRWVQKKCLECPFCEFNMLTQLKGMPHIIQLTDSQIIEDASHAVFFLEYCNNGDLLDYIQSNGSRIGKKMKDNWVKQLVLAISLLHSRQICHLDISLENILIDSNFNLKLADFGQARSFEPGIKLGKDRKRCLGKKGYCSPELYANRSFFGDKADVFSFGVCVFIIYVLVPPYVQAPQVRDRHFAQIWNQDFTNVLKAWKKDHLMTKSEITMLRNIFTNERDRWSIEDVSKHLQNSV